MKCAPLLLATAVAFAAFSPVVVAEERLCFDVIRRHYPPPESFDTGQPNPLYVMSEELFLAQSTWEVRHGIDAESGRRYLERTRLVSITINDEGKFFYEEGEPVSPDDKTVFRQVRELLLNYKEQPVQTHNPARAFYPHVYFDRRFVAVLDRDHPFLGMERLDDDQTIAQGPNFSFTTRWTRELGEVPAEVLQHHLETGGLVKRTRFSEWFLHSDGTWRPAVIEMKTFLGEEEFPVVEANFRLRKNDCPEILPLDESSDDTGFLILD